MSAKRYKDKKWLEKQAVSKKLSTRKIGRMEGVDPETIRHWMIRFGIPRQYCAPTGINHVQLSKEAREFLNGELLGDASIIWGCKPTSAYYSLTSKHEAYLKWIEKQLLSFGIKRRGTLKSYKNKYGIYWLLQSKYYRSEMPELRQLWYPDEKKRVPRNIRSTPFTTKLWFIEDGTAVASHYIKRIEIATNGFLKEDVYFLLTKLKDILETDTIYRTKSNTISITKQDTIKRFYDYIGTCPSEIEEVYGYKWKLC